MTYKLILANGERLIIRVAGRPVIGKTYKLTVQGVKYRAKYASQGLFVQEANTDVLVVAVGCVLAAATITAIVFSMQAETGNLPDAEVLATAQQVGRPVTVLPSEYSLWQGCDSKDSRVYKVIDNATDKQVAIVCRGSALTLLGIPTKAPTLRYLAAQ